MPVDVGDENIRIRVKDPGLFVDSSFRTITISDDQGIKAVIGKLKSDPEGGTTVQSYIFNKEKWTAAEAEKWVKDHTKSSSGNRPERRYVDDKVLMDYPKGASERMIGHAAVFNKRAELWPGFFEEIAPGAFTRAIQSPDIYALWNHNPSDVLGNSGAGTLFLSEDETGLRYEIIPPDTNLGRDLRVLIKRGDVRKSSFGFNVVDEDIQHEGRTVIRKIKDVKLFDVSPVTYPAYKETDVHVRMIAGENEHIYLCEDTGRVIEVPEIQEPQSNFDFFKELDDLKKRVGPK